ncbi:MULTISPECIES: iron-sulfur cluster assembly protein [Actinosynnema]|uniref:iron-sulfur cluster assembly protein n=1 Tax=Actinosynnema TaxID=40566 RepID=UPI0027E2C777|nr:iron-sulfur cluster assembly protein [Actinosynnema pretiosum]MCP2094928.1 Metal-sulfur cluster biosynthetic enzyme [Actinosynnema pretiosum]
MAAGTGGLLVAARAALDGVNDPELDEPITDLGFVRSLVEEPEGVLTAHLRLPTSFCSPNFAYLMASDAKDALTALPGVVGVVVVLDDHHDSEVINRGLALDAGYRGTFGHEAEKDLEELREVFRRKAHTAALERALTSLLRERVDLEVADLHRVTLGELPDTEGTRALLRRRAALGLDCAPDRQALVDEEGAPVPRDQVPARLRFARAVRISVDGNAHFCRGLLRTRYPDSAGDQGPRQAGGDPDAPGGHRLFDLSGSGGGHGGESGNRASGTADGNWDGAADNGVVGTASGSAVGAAVRTASHAVGRTTDCTASGTAGRATGDTATEARVS